MLYYTIGFMIRRVLIELKKLCVSQMPVGSLFPAFSDNCHLQFFLTNLWVVSPLKFSILYIKNS